MHGLAQVHMASLSPPIVLYKAMVTALVPSFQLCGLLAQSLVTVSHSERRFVGLDEVAMTIRCTLSGGH